MPHPFTSPIRSRHLAVLLPLLAATAPAADPATIPTPAPNAQAQESLALTTLRLRISPAERAFHLMAGDPGHAGEYGFISELAALVNRADPHNPLDCNTAWPLIAGYRYTSYLPAGPHGAISDPYPLDVRGNPDDAPLRRQHVLVYAWPETSQDGDRIYALDQTGQIYEHPVSSPGDPPAWNALFTSDSATGAAPAPAPAPGWLDPPAWKIHYVQDYSGERR